MTKPRNALGADQQQPRSVVKLRVWGNDLDPDEITSLLGAAPSSTPRTGELIDTSSGRKFAARHGAWVLLIESHSIDDLDEQIEELLSSLTADLSIWAWLVQRYRCQLTLGLFMGERNEGADLSPEILGMIANRGLAVEVDIYAPN